MSRPGFFPPGFRPLANGAPGYGVKGAFRADGREDKRMSPAATWPAAERRVIVGPVCLGEFGKERSLETNGS